MGDKVLITGGAGFIGSHLADALLQEGYEVRVYDSLVPQVHGQGRALPSYLSDGVEFVAGDVRDREGLERALREVRIVFHLAAAVGVAQSMYEIQRYTEVNVLGTAVLLDILAEGKHQVEKLIVASSMSIYGEGKYECPQCGVVYPRMRSLEKLRSRVWEMECPHCGRTLSPLPTDEDKPLHPASVYAISKRDQEEMCLCVGRAYGIPTVALRYFNVYGPRQALSNPYTGVAAIFSARLLNGNPPLIFEDGLQSRDFVHVSDVVRASLLAMKSEEANYEAFNVGTGRPLRVIDMAHALCRKLRPDIEPVIVNRFREGDIRHCYADISKIRARLGFEPRVRFEEGIEDLIGWIEEQTAADRVELAKEELARRGLLR
ncbi:MAG TPA: SDR family NAD(P)-dependent oxidoreductase [Chloroflexi bacterium]|nr:SDR family NAD(P)-dependent oxidoreductase [Chloroflexota bacterium]